MEKLKPGTSGNDDQQRRALEMATRDLPRYNKEDYSPEDVAEALPRFTAEQMAELAKKYTPEQMKAIEAGEEAVDPMDLATQGMIRRDGLRPWYLDDFATIEPVVDKPIRNPESNYDPRLRSKTEDELAEDYARFYDSLPEEITEEDARLAYRKFEDENRLTVGLEAAERAPASYLAAELPRIEDPGVRFVNDEDESEKDPLMDRVYKQTGFTPEEVSRFRIKTLVQHRVVNQTRMGKIQSEYSLVVAGNGRGLLGIGEGKALEMDASRDQARRAAIRNMQPFVRYERRTIYGEVQAKVGAAVVTMSSRPPGFGLRCQQYIFEICRCVGISDLAARVTRSRNPMNVIKATVAALGKQRLPEEIARGRGKKLVDVRKVYYAGAHARN